VQPYRLVVTLDGVATEYQHTASRLELVESIAGRLDRAPVTVPTTIRFRYLQVAMGTVVIASTGIWTQTFTGNSGTNLDFNWLTSMPTAGSAGRGLLDSGKNDRLYFTEMTNQAGGYTAIAALGAAALVQVDGVTSMVSMGLGSVALDTCRHVLVRNADEYTRLTTTVPGAFTSNLASWGIFALPAADKTGFTGALLVSLGSQANVNADVVATFSDPFVGTSLIARQSIAATYTTSIMAATGVSISNTSQSDFPFASTGSCATDMATLQPTVQIAER